MIRFVMTTRNLLLMGTYKSLEVVKQRLGTQLSSYWMGGRNYAGFGDNEYYLPDPEEVLALLGQIVITPPSFASQRFDCDDYAFVFKGMVSLLARDSDNLTASPCIGLAWGEFGWMGEVFHACNWVLDSSNALRWIEPQTMVLYNLEECIGLNLLIA